MLPTDKITTKKFIDAKKCGYTGYIRILFIWFLLRLHMGNVMQLMY